MQAFIQSIAEKAGITEDQAKIAFNATLGTLKTKLPPSISNQMDNLMEGKEFDFRSVLQDKLSDLKEDAAEKLSYFKEEASETFEDIKEEATEKFNNLKEGLKKIF